MVRNNRYKDWKNANSLLSDLLVAVASLDLKGPISNGASPITIPEAIAGRISAPVPSSFLNWGKEGLTFTRLSKLVYRKGSRSCRVAKAVVKKLSWTIYEGSSKNY